MSKIADFLGKGPFFLATCDGDQPKVRPLGMFLEMNGTIYFGIGTFKDCWKQIEANPKVEVVAMGDGPHWMRYTGTAVIETTDDIANAALEANPHLKNIYNEQTGNKMGIFHLENATAVDINMMPAMGCENIL